MTLNASKIFPTILIALDVLAALVYLIKDKDVRMGIYWISAAALTASITY